MFGNFENFEVLYPSFKQIFDGFNANNLRILQNVIIVIFSVVMKQPVRNEVNRVGGTALNFFRNKSFV